MRAACIAHPLTPPLTPPPPRPSFTPSSARGGAAPLPSMKIPAWKKEMAQTSFRQAVVAEFVATFMFIFSTIGCVV